VGDRPIGNEKFVAAINCGLCITNQCAAVGKALNIAGGGLAKSSKNVRCADRSDRRGRFGCNDLQSECGGVWCVLIEASPSITTILLLPMSGDAESNDASAIRYGLKLGIHDVR